MFTFKINGCPAEEDYPTYDQCIQAAIIRFDAICENEGGWSNNEEVTGQADVYTVDDNGNETFFKFEDVKYTHYHGDYAEHNTYWG